MFELKKMKDKLRSVDKNILTILSLFLIVTLYTYYPYLKTGDLPLTDASGHFFNTWYLKKILTEDHTFPNWCEYWYSGHPFLLLYSPMTYLLVILLSFTGLSLVSAFNLVLFLSVYGQTLLIFFLMRKITDDNYVSAFSALLLISSPRFFKDVIYSGSLPNQVASTIGLLVLYLYINRDLNLRHIVYISLALAGVVYAHHENSPVVVIAMLCILLSLIIFDKKNVSKHISIFFLIMVLTSLLMLFWGIPALINLKMMIQHEIQGQQVNIKNWIDPHNLRYFGKFHILLAILGFPCASFLSWKKMRKNQADGYKYLFVVFYVLSFVYLAHELNKLQFEGASYLRYIPILSEMHGNFFETQLIYPFALIGAFPIFLIRKLVKNREAFLVVLGLMILLTTPYISMNHDRAKIWHEGAITKDYFEPIYNFIRNAGNGKTITYGIYQPAMSSAIPVRSGRRDAIGWIYENDWKFHLFEREIHPDLDLSANINNGFYLYNLYQKGAVDTIILVLQGSGNTFLSYLKNHQEYFAPLASGRGILIVSPIPRPKLIYKVKPVTLYGNLSLVHPLFALKNGYKLTLTKDEGFPICLAVGDVDLSTIDNALKNGREIWIYKNSNVVQKYNLIKGKMKKIGNGKLYWTDNATEIIAKLGYYENVIYNISREPDKISINLENPKTGYYHFSESYYPYWRGAEIHPSIFGFMILKLDAQDNIIEYKFPYYFLFLKIISLITFIGLMILLWRPSYYKILVKLKI
ncbi:MAG: hypothetical protein ACE5J9_00340 [Methanosarcinales archaeon]